MLDSFRTTSVLSQECDCNPAAVWPGGTQLFPLPDCPHVPAKVRFRGAGPDGVLPHVSSRGKDVVIPSRGTFRRVYLPPRPVAPQRGFSFAALRDRLARQVAVLDILPDAERWRRMSTLSAVLNSRCSQTPPLAPPGNWRVFRKMLGD